jgi:hypothetical protein
LFQEKAGMAELHVVSALRTKRAELAGMVGQLEQQLARQRTNLAHLDATMRLFDPDVRPQEIRANSSGREVPGSARASVFGGSTTNCATPRSR